MMKIGEKRCTSLTAAWRNESRVESMFAPCDSGRLVSLRAELEKLLAIRHHPLSGFQSPEWLEWLCRGASADAPVVLNTISDLEKGIVGATPLVLGRLRFDHNLSLFHPWKPLMAADVIGGMPLLEQSSAYLDAFFRSVFSCFPAVQVVHMRMLPVLSECAGYLAEPGALGNFAMLYTPGGEFASHSISIPDSMGAYLAGFPSKRRYLFGRSRRKLEESFGAVTVRRFRTPDEAEVFLSASQRVIDQSWQSGTGWLLRDDEPGRATVREMARRGLFRSYILSAGGRPCAYAYGYQLRGVYHYDQPGFDPAFREFSPGTLLLLSIIEDLIASDRAECLSFGYGDSHYKGFLANRHERTVTAMVMRRTPLNRARVLLHSLWLRRLKPVARTLRSAVSSVGVSRAVHRAGHET